MPIYGPEIKGHLINWRTPRMHFTHDERRLQKPEYRCRITVENSPERTVLNINMEDGDKSIIIRLSKEAAAELLSQLV